MPKVSVIVPVYNVEKYLPRCLNSLINQTLRDIEIILVDDESPDKSPEICDSYAQNDSRIKVIHKKNEGLGFARNSGLKIAKGEYISFIDSDDYLDNDTYENLYNLATQNKLDAIFFTFEIFTNDNKSIGHCNSTKVNYIEGNDKCKHFLLEMIGTMPEEKEDRKYQVSACTSFYNHDIIKLNNILFHSERELISEDLIFNIDFLYFAKKIAYQSKSYYHYFVNTDSLSHTIRYDRIEKNIKIFRYITSKLYELGFDKKEELRVMRLFIGYSRSAILSIYKCPAISAKEKNKWLYDICHLSIWKEIYSKYPVSKLPFKYALFLFAKRYKLIWLIKIMACR